MLKLSIFECTDLTTANRPNRWIADPGRTPNDLYESLLPIARPSRNLFGLRCDWDVSRCYDIELHHKNVDFALARKVPLNSIRELSGAD